MGKICSRGVWDETVPGIAFDENGISNYALLFDRLCKHYPRGEEGKEKWLAIVDSIKKAGKNKKYDCIIGVSGGTDSSYLLHIAKEYNLKPLAVNLDNGWNSDIAVKNIKKMTNKLGIDLETYVIEYEEIKDIFRSYILAGLPWIDLPTDLAIKAILYKTAARENIKFVISGSDFRSEGSQPHEWTYGDGRQLNYVHNLFGRVKLKTYPLHTLASVLYFGLVRQIKSIFPFYYLDYKKNEAQKFLIENYGWEYYGGHHYENQYSKFAISYWMFEKFGIDKRKITLSAQVLSGEITRDQAVKMLENPPFDKNTIEQTLEFVLKKLDLSRSEFETIMSSANKSYHDYPSYSFIYNNMSGLYKYILKYILLHKPQSLFQDEMRHKK